MRCAEIAGDAYPGHEGLPFPHWRGDILPAAAIRRVGRSRGQWRDRTVGINLLHHEHRLHLCKRGREHLISGAVASSVVKRGIQPTWDSTLWRDLVYALRYDA